MKLVWDKSGERRYETGVKKGVLYPLVNGAYPQGYVWNGLTGVSESPSGAEETKLWADDIKYLSLYSAEEFGATIEAYTYPEEFEACDGSATIAQGAVIGQQARKPFGLSYVTTVGNDEDGAAHGYKIHLIYGATAKPSQRAYKSVNDSPEAITFSWEVGTVPVNVPGFDKPTANIVIDSTKATESGLKALEDALYGTAEKEAYLPLPEQVIELLGTKPTP